MCSVWKSSYKTGKRLRLDWTKTDQDWKFTRLIKTTTMVQSLVHHIFKVFKTSLNQSQLVFLASNVAVTLEKNSSATLHYEAPLGLPWVGNLPAPWKLHPFRWCYRFSQVHSMSFK